MDVELEMTFATARDYQDAIADVLCWFMGFSAANPNADLPPGLPDLRNLNSKLKDEIYGK